MSKCFISSMVTAFKVRLWPANTQAADKLGEVRPASLNCTVKD